MPPTEHERRLTALEQILLHVDLGDRGPDGGLPYWVAIKVRAAQQLEPQLLSAIQLIAHGRTQEGAKGDGQNRFMTELIDDICPPGWPKLPPIPPRPHWSDYVAKLGELAERYPANSVFSDAAFDLAQRVLTRAQQLHNQAK